MRLQTALFTDGKKMHSKIVRAEDIEEALTRFIGSEDTPRAYAGYAHPLGQDGPKPSDWRWRIRCSITGKVTMQKRKPNKNVKHE